MKHEAFGTWRHLIWYVGTKPRRMAFPQFPHTRLPFFTDDASKSFVLTNICHNTMRHNLEDSNLPRQNIYCSTRLQISPEASSSPRLYCVLEDRRTDVWFPEGTRNSSLRDRIWIGSEVLQSNGYRFLFFRQVELSGFAAYHSDQAGPEVQKRLDL
jgi:hypothetical protein